MDKYEYKLKLEQLKNLAREKEYETAAEIADTINWRKIKSAATLYMIGEIYDRNKRYEDSREILLMAYDRSSSGRNIIYRLALVALKMGNLEEAKDYYEEFLEIAPNDNLRYVLRYEIAKMSGAPLGELIEILEEFKDREYTEEWAFELAYLYHRAGDSQRCVEVCDELILWFGDGKYVEKAMELKMLYQPLSSLQQQKYRQCKLRKVEMTVIPPADTGDSMEHEEEAEEVSYAETTDTSDSFGYEEEPEEVSYADTGEESDFFGYEEEPEEPEEVSYADTGEEPDFFGYEEEPEEPEEVSYADTAEEPDFFGYEEEPEEAEEVPAEEPPAAGQDLQNTAPLSEVQSAGRFHTINLQAELARNMKEIMNGGSQKAAADTMDTIKKMVGEIPYLRMQEETGKAEENTYTDMEQDYEQESFVNTDFGGILEEEYDGQISLFIPESVQRETQITGQMSIEDMLNQGERTGQEDAGKPELEPDRKREPEPIIEKKQEKWEPEVPGEDIKDIMERLKGVIPSAGSRVVPQRLTPELSQQRTTELPKTGHAVEPVKVPESTINLEKVSRALERKTMWEQQEEKEATVSSDSYLTSILRNEIEFPEEEIELAGIEEEPITSLNEEQKEIFSYFVPVTGMEQQLCQVLEGTLHRRGDNRTSATGNILIMGGKGSGKTVLATDIIKAIQKSRKNVNGKIGKIAASSLNQKDLLQLMKKVTGGYLIIEKAGELSQETVTRLSLLMEQDTGGLLVIMEDTRVGIDKVLARDPGFTRKFTERIKIPVFTSDELVEFAKAYALEHECEIDDMGILALYNCISNIQRLDEATTLTEVKEIVDEAMNHADCGGLKKLFGGKKYSPKGYLYLREKDFPN